MKTGIYDGKKVLNLTVSVCELDNGGVQSTHDFASQEDGEVSMKMESGGARQIAFALFSEAVRRELYMDVLLQLQGDPKFLGEYRAASSRGKRQLEKILGDKAQRIMVRNLARMAPEAAREVLEMMLESQEGTHD